jgi:DNA-binding response OmpR family regulator
MLRDYRANTGYHCAMTKVLLIDDDRKHSELMQAYFKRHGINLSCAYDSVEGFKKLAREEPDLLLLDVMLPGKDGFEICREVRKTSNIPIIMLILASHLSRANWLHVCRRLCVDLRVQAKRLAS